MNDYLAVFLLILLFASPLAFFLLLNKESWK